MSRPAAQTLTSPWAAHRRRGQALRDRHPHATQVLTLYLALLDAWEQAWRRALASQPQPHELAGWATEQVAPRIVTATVQFGPDLLAAAVSDLHASGEIEPLLVSWLAGAEPEPVGRYLARAVLRGPLEAVDAAAACARDPSPRGGRHCPSCGGRPQLSFRTDAEDALVSGRRYLSCVRCGSSWPYASSSCAWCGQTAGSRTVFAEHRERPVVGRGGSHAATHGRPGPSRGSVLGREPARESRERSERQQNGQAPGGDAPLFPHLRIEACEACARYLIDVDLSLDTRAVPEVDELAALPLDLFATERGLAKIAPNLMGF